MHVASCACVFPCAPAPHYFLKGRALGDVAGHLMHASVPAANRWESIAPIFALLSFLILLASVGPTAWLYVWPLSVANRMFNDNLGPQVSDWQKDVSKRLLKVSTFMGEQGLLITVTLLNVAFIPMDALLRYLDKSDCHLQTNKRIPLVYQLLDPVANPIRVARQQIFALLQPEGDLMFVLDLWHASWPAGDDFWSTWGYNAIRIQLHQDGSVYIRLEEACKSYPIKSWELPRAIKTHGRNSAAARQASSEMMRTPDCCKDAPFTQKACNIAGDEFVLRTGSVGQGMVNAAPSLRVLNIDLERDQAKHRAQISRGFRPPSLPNLSRRVALHTCLEEHKRMGGKDIDVKLTGPVLEAAGVDTRRAFKNRRKTPVVKKAKGVSGSFVMFRAVEINEWKKKMPKQQRRGKRKRILKKPVANLKEP